MKTANVDYDIFAVSFYTFRHGTAAQLTERLKAWGAWDDFTLVDSE